MREENISFSNNYIIYELNIPIITIYNKPWLYRNAANQAVMSLNTNSPPAEVSTQW